MVKAKQVACVYVDITGEIVGRNVSGFGPLPGPAEDWQVLWERFAAWMRAEGVEPLWFPAQQYDVAHFSGAFQPADAERVVAWLGANGVPVEAL